MSEIKKIRLTKDLPWVGVGVEKVVLTDSYGEFIEISFSSMNDHQRYRFYLTDIEGWYEVVHYRPGIGEKYWYVDGRGQPVCEKFLREDLSPWIRINNAFPETGEGFNQCKKVGYHIRAIFKEGV